MHITTINAIITLETILTCYNYICNADSMHVVPNVNQVHTLFRLHLGKQRQSAIRPYTIGSRIQPHHHYLLGTIIGSASPIPHNENEPSPECLCMHNKSMQHSIHGI